jgi:CheY-like chemotaxis protein
MATDARLDGRHDGPDGSKRLNGHVLRVLIVDDDADTSDTMAILLNHWGFEPIAVRNGSDALQAAQTHGPDLILLDIGMPGMDGLELAKRLRAQVPPKKKVPFLVAVSGYGDAQTRLRSQEAGIDLHLVKPVDPTYLEKLLQRFQTIVMPAAERRLPASRPRLRLVPSLRYRSERAAVKQYLQRAGQCVDIGHQLRSRLRLSTCAHERSGLRAAWCEQAARFLGEAEKLRLLFTSFERWGINSTDR